MGIVSVEMLLLEWVCNQRRAIQGLQTLRGSREGCISIVLVDDDVLFGITLLSQPSFVLAQPRD